MKSAFSALAFGLLAIATIWSTTGCNSSSSPDKMKDKMGMEGKMNDDKMGSDKMDSEKMSDEKMEDK